MNKVDEVLKTVGLELTDANREAYIGSLKGIEGHTVGDISLADDCYFNAILKSIGK